MNIVVKVAPSRVAQGAQLVTDVVRGVLPKDVHDAVSVEPVFPDVTSGRRAGLLVLSLDEDTSPRDVTRILETLRASDDVEYAQEPAPRAPLSSDRDRS